MAAKSRTSSDATRAARRAVSIRSRKDSAGGFLRRTSTGGRTMPEPAPGLGRTARLGGCSVCEGASATDGSAPVNAARARLYRDFEVRTWIARRRAAPAALDPGAGQRLDAGVLERAGEAFAQLDPRLPAQLLPCERDVGLADL